jgi:hypothetical protein
MTVILRRVDAKLTNERTTIEAVNLGQSPTEGERVSRSSKQRIDGHAERKERAIMPEPGIIQTLSAVGTAFTASLVECVEALTTIQGLPCALLSLTTRKTRFESKRNPS